MQNSLFDRLDTIWCERRMGISTRGIVPTDHPDSVHYATMAYRTIRGILGHLDLRSSDVFVDIGSGKGRVLCCAARRPVRRVVGVELSADLCRQARTNAERLQGRRAPITVENTPADTYDYAGATVLFLFNPFEARTLRSALERIAEGTHGRGLRIAYAEPAHEEVFREQPWLDAREHLARGRTGWTNDVSFYRSRQ
ncbi:methyltransferase domain-containing protein [Actinoplanes sp. CA-030573]|uniref:methyltransferase domain-containing protein n=1 Tax=Actinoplanes sp. CA-030573 TaxID=3239898 RepID=UPI003D90D673